MLNILAVESPHNCTNCEDRELASARCLDCVENLCENCVTAHERIRQTKFHRIVSFEELQNNTVDESIRCPSFCKIHDREVSSFCQINFQKENNIEKYRKPTIFAAKTSQISYLALLKLT